jgi:deoxyribodipyrimidine photolyase-related protein
MTTGNIALLAGLDVKQVQDWYLAVYSNAYESVAMPNTLGMALFGEAGLWRADAMWQAVNIFTA